MRRRLLAAALAAATCAAGAGASEPVHDPWEGMNRGIFRFNEAADRYVVEHVASALDAAFPEPLQLGIRNAFDNVRFPIRFVNCLLQGKPTHAAEELGRFLVDSTLGIGGLFDASGRGGVETHDEDFGQTLGVWGVPQGPYLVLPILGPSGARDFVGLLVDTGSGVYGYFIPIWVSVSITSGRLLNERSLLLEEIRSERASALDFYAFQRNAYLSNRRSHVLDLVESDAPPPQDEDLYYFDDEGDE